MSTPDNLALRWKGPLDVLFLRLLPAKPIAFIRRSGTVFIGFQAADRFTHTSTADTTHPFDRLEAWVNSHSVQDSGPQLSVGYISYDTKNFLADFSRRRGYAPLYPEITFLHFTEGLFLDTEKQVMYLRIPSESKRDEIAALLLATENPRSAIPSSPTDVRFTAFPAYSEKIRRIQHYLREGDSYEVNHTERFTFKYRGAAGPLFARLLAESDALRATWIRDDSLTILSATLEDFVAVRGEKIESKPMKGTRASAGHKQLDDALIEELRNSRKDRAEHVMIVDVVRNDLGRVCRPGTVAVTRPFEVISYPTVHHMVSTIEGQLRTDTRMADILRAVFPAASVTGAPKIRATEIIDELEETPRGIYTGAIGLIGGPQDYDLSMGIRTLTLRGEDAVYGTGGGIVIDSDPRAEYEECSAKTEVLLRALFGGSPAAPDEENIHLLGQRPLSRPA
ncbi:MAG: aminodeoxychorismate synthase component I [Nitrospirae bacterium]|nr:aminodeoxychorismate synthase component I [Nitrospirota bacterium]